MFSRGKLLVQMALEKKSQTDDVSSPRINITLQGSNVVSGPVWSDREDRPPDITCYESDISDTEITPSTNPIIEAHLQTQTENQFLRESDTELDPVPHLNEEVSLLSGPSDTTDEVNILPKPSGSIANQIFPTVDHTYPFYIEETRENDNEISEEDEVQSEELDDSGADEDYRPGSHDDDDPNDSDISSEDSDS